MDRDEQLVLLEFNLDTLIEIVKMAENKHVNWDEVKRYVRRIDELVSSVSIDDQ